MPHVLAIDQSTSATKALLYTVGGELVDQASVEHHQIYPRPGWVEHHADEIWRNLLTVVGEVVGRNREVFNDGPLCLSLTNQRETFVVFDRRTGRPLRNAIVWQCRRGDKVCTELLGTGHERMIRRKTGLRIDSYFSGPKIAWLMRSEPHIATRVRDGEALVGTIDAYLVYRLTGGSVFATDHTNASRTLLYDIESLAWDDELCRLFTVPPAALPEVRDSFDAFGETDVEGLLPRRVPIRGVMGDSQAALFAHACFRPGTAKVTFGSGSSVLLNIGGERPRETHNDNDCGAVTSLAWVYRGRPTYCLEGLINYSAATLAWVRDRLGLIASFDEAEPAAELAGNNGGVYLVPAFAGLGAPHWRPAARAAVVGLSAHSGREHIVRAALESIAYQVRDVLDMMRSSGAGVDLREIHADGGATTNRFLMQFTADIIGIELRVADVADCSALGAAMAGACGAGAHRSLDDLANLAPASTSYRPAMEQTRVEQNLSGWRAAVAAVLSHDVKER